VIRVKSFDYEAVTFNGAVYCTGCLPEGVDVDSDDVCPIFADSEWDYFPSCDTCLKLHTYMNLTDEGMLNLVQTLRGELTLWHTDPDGARRRWQEVHEVYTGTYYEGWCWISIQREQAEALDSLALEHDEGCTVDSFLLVTWCAVAGKTDAEKEEQLRRLNVIRQRAQAILKDSAESSYLETGDVLELLNFIVAD
jgi:hypothetical protein